MVTLTMSLQVLRPREQTVITLTMLLQVLRQREQTAMITLTML